MKCASRSFVSCFLCVLILFCLLPAPVHAASASGTCGDNAVWSLYNGSLTLSGTGETWNFYDDKPCPWEKWKNEIRQVVVKEGITALGAGAFIECDSLERVMLPDSLISIGNCAIFMCRKLSECELPPHLEHLGQENFMRSAITSATIPASVTFLDSGIYQYSPNLETVYIEGDPDAPGFVYGSGMFSCCPSLRTIEVEEDHIALRSIDGVLFSKSGKMLVVLPGGYMQRSYRIPSGTSEVFQGAMDGDRSIEDYGYIRRLIVPDSVAEIGPLNDCRWAGELHFEGDAPAGIEESLRLDSTDFLPVTVYYPKNNATWTEVIEQAAKHEEIVWIEEEPLTISGLAANKTAAEVEEPITWTAEAVGGIGTLQYAFRVYKDGTIVQKGTYSKAPTFTYTPGETGTYKVRAYVKDASGTIVSKTGAGVTVTAGPTLTSVKAGVTSAYAGEKITWTAAASGGSGTLKYYFILYKDGTKLKTRSYSTTNTFSYTPAEAGSYKVKVYVKDAEGTKVSKTSSQVAVTLGPPAIISVKAGKTSSAVGEEITWTAAAVGSEQPLRYYFILYKDGTKLKTRSYSTKNTFSYTPTEAGSYKVKVYVKDAEGTKVYKNSAKLTVS